MTTQTAKQTDPVSAVVPAQHRPPAVQSDGEATRLVSSARRALAVVRGLRSLRPVPARPQEPYGESDGQ